jgi:hypothetical protein
MFQQSPEITSTISFRPASASGPISASSRIDGAAIAQLGGYFFATRRSLRHIDDLIGDDRGQGAKFRPDSPQWQKYHPRKPNRRQPRQTPMNSMTAVTVAKG